MMLTRWLSWAKMKNTKEDETALRRLVVSSVGATTILDYLGSTARCTLLLVIVYTDRPTAKFLDGCSGKLICYSLRVILIV